MKKLLLFVLIVALFAGCGKKTDPPETPPSEAGFEFTEENYPRVDGSTATIPLIEAVECALLGKERSEVSVTVSKTSGAYIALARNEADVLLVYDGGEETRRTVTETLNAVSSNTDIVESREPVDFDRLFETVSIGKDALVFLVNRDNPVENITTEQVRKIFTGEYTNWSQLGGSDEPIRAYQRGIGSGSQALMDKLVMPGLQMADTATVPTIGDMGGLIDAVADFAGGPGGIGYNVYFYVTEMRENDYIKVLSIDGVAPTYETIQSNEYPFVSDFYSVIRSDEPADSPARALHEWMLSDEAQNLMASENYVALHADPSADTPNVDGEFSFYPEGEAPEYFEGVNLYSLEARDDYGQLYFYLGGTRSDDFSYPAFYGICTEAGKIVTKPVYTAAKLLTDSNGNHAYFCYRGDRAPVSQTVTDGDWTYERNIYPVLLFATDGSWVREFDGGTMFEGFTGASDMPMNADYLAVMQGDKWGAVNLMGETVMPFDRDSYDGIYNKTNNEGGYPYRALTENRYIGDVGENESGNLIFSLLDGNLNPVASGLIGGPSSMTGDCIVTSDGRGNGNTIRTYTLDGELIAALESGDVKYQGASTLGDYVIVYTELSFIICDRELNILYEYDNVFSERHNIYYPPFALGPGVLFSSDTEAFFHRTYLPDGTRLVTWYDPEMNT